MTIAIMTSVHDNYEKDLGAEGPDEKGQGEHIDAKDFTGPAASSLRPTRTFEAPKSIRNMTSAKRQATESKLKRKVDLRLMPMIILMYTLNYLDRLSVLRHGWRHQS